MKVQETEEHLGWWGGTGRKLKNCVTGKEEGSVGVGKVFRGEEK